MKKKMISDRTGTSGPRRSHTNPQRFPAVPVGLGIGTSIFLMLVLTAPAMLWAETPSAGSGQAPSTGSGQAPSTDSTRASTELSRTSSPQASSLQETGGQAGQAETPKTATAPVPKKVAGTAYDKNTLTALPGSPEVSSKRGTSSAVTEVGTYDQLVAAIRGVQAESQARVEQAVEQENVREAWETGKLIDAHVLQHKERADYAKQVLPKLAGDLGMSERELYYMLEFYRAYPILRHAAKLSWSEHESLLAINDAKEREAVAEQAEKENWTRARLREEVKMVTKKEKPSGEAPAPVELISPVPHSGNPGTYKIILAKTGPYEGELALDLGFSNYVRLADVVGDMTPFKEGEVVVFKKEEGEVRKTTESELYTYRAWVNRVLDGDTIEAVIDLGFGFTTTQVLRFRGIDAPEIFYKDSATKKADPSLSQTTTQSGAGTEAKEFVEKILIGDSVEGIGDRKTKTESVIARGAKQSQPIFIRTSKSDKYDRYLVDIFFTNPKGEEIYLNNLLLQEGLAVKVQS